MHGRLKVKSTAEQQEAKRKEREKKLKIYNAATSKIFKKKEDGELDEELLSLTGEVLAVNPDFYTLWNYRKETFLKLTESEPQEKLQKMYDNELWFLQSCLKINPKSYGTWHHRCFVLKNMPEPDWARELELCNTFLTYDERNFHCWDYRRFVLQHSNVTPQSEFEFSMSKISSNFSNYSSWHYRSQLLPVIHPDATQPMGVTEEAILREYELVQNGFFTDPDDQSNWFYHRWLMGRGEQSQKISSCVVSRRDSRIVFSLAKAIQLDKSVRIDVQLNGQTLEDLRWCNHLDNKKFSTTWVAENVAIPKGDCRVKVTVVTKDESVCTDVQLSGEEEMHTLFLADATDSSMFSAELSAVKNETLQQELESIQQLMELETDNKWVALTEVLIMKALDPVKFSDNIMTSLDKLEALDFKRKNYYKDLRSKFLVENAIDVLTKSIEKSSLSLTNQKLTKFFHLELLPFLSDLDLSDNQLTDVCHFSHLQNLRNLTLDGNCITSCQGLEHLRLIESISLQNNHISDAACLKSLEKCPKLKRVFLQNNPICQVPAVANQIKELIPSVDVILL